MKTTCLIGVVALGASLCAVPVGAAANAPTAVCSASSTDPADNVLTIDTVGPHLPGATITVSGQCFAPGQRLAIKMDVDDYGQIGADPDEEVPTAARPRIAVGPDGSFSGESIVIPCYNRAGGATLAGDHTLYLLDNDPVTSNRAVFQTVSDFTANSELLAPDRLRVWGTGWLNRTASEGSQAIVQIESQETGEAVTHVPGHTPDADRPFVWAALDVAADGSYDQIIELPDGSDLGGRGTGAVAEGNYVARVRSGYGLAGGASDINRSVPLHTTPFVVTPLRPRLDGGVSLSGVPKVGAELRVNVGTWLPTRSTLSVQWLRNGQPIPGATGRTRVLGPADQGSRYSARVTARHGSVVTTQDTASTMVTAGVAKPGTARIVGKARVGQKLKVRTANWAAGTRLTRQWLVNGKAVKGAVQPTFRLKKAHRGKRVVVRVTGTRAGYVTVRTTAKAVRVRR